MVSENGNQMAKKIFIISYIDCGIGWERAGYCDRIIKEMDEH